MLYKAMSYADEVWTLITGDIVPNIKENWYIVSNYGYISNIDYHKHHKVYSPKYGGQFGNRLYINLTDNQGNGMLVILPRIVAKVYCPGYREDLDVNHKDGNPLNNYYGNLEWATRSENIRHAYDNNLIQSKLNDEIVHNICMHLEQDILSMDDIAKVTGLYEISDNPIALISAIKKKKLWTHISDQYKIPMGRHGRLFTDDQIKMICTILEKDINADATYILNILGVVPENITMYRRYSSTISAIRYHRKYVNISSSYSF